MNTFLRVKHGSFGRLLVGELHRPIVKHVHRHGHIIFKISGGDAACVIKDRSCTLDDEKFVVINAWESHSLSPCDASHPPNLLGLYLEPNWLSAITKSPELSRAWGFLYADLTPEVAALRDLLVRPLIEDVSVDQDVSDQLVFELASILLLRHSKTETCDRRSCSDKRIEKALSLISENSGRIFRMEAVAREVGMSRARFFAHFKSALGISPTLFANQMLMEVALREMEARKLSLADLSLSLGFSDQTSFTRFFRKNMGPSPGMYRGALTSS